MLPNKCECCTDVCTNYCCNSGMIGPSKGGDRLQKLQFVPTCGIENCKIFGGHDSPYIKKTKFLSKTPKRKFLEKPIGLICTVASIKSNYQNDQLESQCFAIILKAFAKIYLLSEHKWTGETINEILFEGDQLFIDCKSFEPDEEDDNRAAYDKAELQIKREFDMNGVIFHIELSDKFELNPTHLPGQRAVKKIKEEEAEEIEVEEEESAGEFLKIPDLPFQMFESHIKGFFKKYNYCLIKCARRYLLVWRALGAYFVFDINGRNCNDLRTDLEKGVVVLICLKDLDNVIYLIRKISYINEKEDKFNIRELKMVGLYGPGGSAYSLDYGIRSNQYEIINWDYAFVRSNLHLTLKRVDPLRNRSALPVGIAALLALKIDHPATWNEAMLDKIICHGVNMCRRCWINCLDKNEPIDLSQFPNELKMGQFWIKYDLNPRKYEGFWKCVPSYTRTDLALRLKSAFDAGDDKVLLQIGYQMYAIWHKNKYYYIFDPYRHYIVGQRLPEGKPSKSASLRIFCTFDTFMRVLNSILLEKTTSSRFYLHVIKVQQIILMKDLKLQESSSFRDAPKDDVEVQSINENICFEENLIICLEELGQISDTDEEEEEIPMSEYEEEEMPGEEEEGEPQNILDEDLESISSGKKSRRKKTKGKSKGKKQSKGKSKHKEGTEQAMAIDVKETTETTETKETEETKETKETKMTKETKTKETKETKETKSKESAELEQITITPEDEPKRDDKVNKNDKKNAKKGTPGKEKKPDKEVEKTKKDKRLSGDIDGRRRKLLDEACKVARKKKVKCGESDDDDKLDTCAQDTDNESGYPGYGAIAHDMAVVGSESGTYESICKLLRSGFKCADRVLCMTPWGTYVVFRGWNFTQKIYFLFDGCTCNVNRFRYLDISSGASGLMSFSSLNDLINYMIDSRQLRTSIKENRERLVDVICRQYSV